MAEKKRQDKSIYEKMLAIMENVEYLQKDDKVDYGQNKYKAMSEEKVTKVFRKELIKQGLVVFPVEQTAVREGNITTTNTTYKMVNVDNPEDYIFLASSGQGSDTQDKGVGKAMTYSFKYMLLRTFAIPTGEDPDKISSAQIDDEQNRAEIKKKIQDNEIDTAKFLYSMSAHFRKGRGEDWKGFKAVDEMQGEELEYALSKINEKIRADKEAK